MTTTIHVVTPCMNAAATIDRTILSVVSQAGDFRLCYHVQDGASTDGTLERLARWRTMLGGGGFPIPNRGVDFSFASSPDRGMYDALITGFDSMVIPKDSFMTWINADDVLMTGACALIAAVHDQFARTEVAWVGGAVTIIRDDMVTTTYDRQIATAAIRHGLCDGRHWDFVQQEGTFFRRWLWDAANPQESIRPMRLAGDWNLWRLFARHASLVQSPAALGGFRVTGQQLSALQRDKYLAEIEAAVPADERAAKLRELVGEGGIWRRRLRGTFSSSILSVYEHSVHEQAHKNYLNVFKAEPAPPASLPKAGELLAHQGRPRPADAPGEGDGTAPVVHLGSFSIFDRGWQFPAVTEQHAAARLRDSCRADGGHRYVAYPWATLIDNLAAGSANAEAVLAEFRAFCRTIPADRPRLTVCQHISGRRYVNLFREAGIHTVFWSHATHEDVAGAEGAGGVRFLPFPLYPVQIPQALPAAAPEADGAPRPHLFSFIGARANSFYLTRVRDLILDQLARDPRGRIVGRDDWHYQKVVYDLQIRGKGEGSGAATLVDDAASDEFRASLVASVFSLCPSGSGPNSIRLWETLGAGAIPVILADTWAPPGDRALWDAAALFCAETEAAVKALPDRLAAIAADPARLAAMRHAGRQLWLLYGPDGFTTDIELMLLDLATTPGRDAAAADGREARGRLVALAGRVRPGEAGAERAAGLFLLGLAGEALLAPPALAAALAGEPEVATAAAAARATLGPDHATVAHADRVIARARALAAARPPAAPALLAAGAPRVCLLGRHAHRTPLAYPPYRKLAAGRIAFVDRPEDADVVMTGFNLDLRENRAALAAARAARPGLRFLVVSEEPLWDSVWSDGLEAADRELAGAPGPLPYRVLSHVTSDLFRFRRLPYFVTTSDALIVRFRGLLAREAGRSAAGRLALWQAAPVRAAFIAEHRRDPRLAVAAPGHDLEGLSVFRTEVAALMAGEGVLRAGKGWAGDGRRQDLPDWHLDKLATLAGRAYVVSALENTHHPDYVSEKLFDAFAVGGLPVFHASPRHRVRDLVPEASFVNTHGLDAAAAAARLGALRPDLALAEAVGEGAAALARLVADTAALIDERRRIADGVMAAVAAVL